MKKILFTLLILSSLSVQAQVKDTTKIDSSSLLALPDTVRKLRSSLPAYIPPAVFITYGVLSFPVKAIRNLDHSIYNDLIQDVPNFNYHIENYFQYAPIVMVYGLNLAGIHGKNTFIDRTILIGMSEGIMALTTFSIKKISHRLRPDGSNYYSFPSGHTGNAFAAAEFMAQEYSEKSIWYGIAGYSFATATAILRVYNRDHWFSDIIAGAGFGIISTKLAYLIYPLFRNKLFHDKHSDKTSIIMPSYSNGIAGFSFVKQL
ncbi:phosphatase PAP2 family protein [Mucilaginibacter achroorhodeus]|uniref:Phosphatase PAP2 family protein n=1 Tax=Mucilaginibacter achroorhodeus TaxID=2599294 RepID=A0A563U9V9_9SPHI|nr:phosphatase PAP2 family protein [Mucilaginibacter achroorhodeus]TWR28172.1 phosphatase PAP2 family protein [Mucilaginibacter achroorhodeus]